MKKILIAQELNTVLQQQNSFLSRADVRVFTASSNDQVLEVHRAERMHLIIAELDMPGISSEQLYSLIRKDAELRAVSVLMVCPNTRAAIEQSSRCGVNAVLMRPVNPALLLAKAQQLLEVSWREAYRVLVSIDGKAETQGNPSTTTFFCRSQDISASGMLFETDKSLIQGDRVVCSFFLPGSTRIQAAGEIVRTIEKAPEADVKQYGVKFSDLSPEAKQALVAFIDKQSLKKRRSVS